MDYTPTVYLGALCENNSGEKMKLITYFTVIGIFILLMGCNREMEESKGCITKYVGYYNESGQFVNETHSFPVDTTILMEAVCSAKMSSDERRKYAKDNNLTTDEFGNIEYNMTWTNNSLFIGNIIVGDIYLGKK